MDERGRGYMAIGSAQGAWNRGWLPRALLALMNRSGAGDATRRESDAGAARTARFEQFFRQHESRITGYLWRMTGDIDLAADLCQETFLRAWQHFDAVAAYPQPQAWLFRVATNLTLNHARRPVALALDPRFDPAGSDPGRGVAERDLLRQALLAVPSKPRAALILRAVNDLTYAEIGELLEMSPDAVKMAVSRAREQFRQAYRRKDTTY
jgi:RNA polymerase sigma-70 factor (ECF subfamily)